MNKASWIFLLTWPWVAGSFAVTQGVESLPWVPPRKVSCYRLKRSLPVSKFGKEGKKTHVKPKKNLKTPTINLVSLIEQWRQIFSPVTRNVFMVRWLFRSDVKEMKEWAWELRPFGREIGVCPWVCEWSMELVLHVTE